jgi:hypothetical protein
VYAGWAKSFAKYVISASPRAECSLPLRTTIVTLQGLAASVRIR